MDFKADARTSKSSSQPEKFSEIRLLRSGLRMAEVFGGHWLLYIYCASAIATSSPRARHSMIRPLTLVEMSFIFPLSMRSGDTSASVPNYLSMTLTISAAVRASSMFFLVGRM